MTRYAVATTIEDTRVYFLGTIAMDPGACDVPVATAAERALKLNDRAAADHLAVALTALHQARVGGLGPRTFYVVELPGA